MGNSAMAMETEKVESAHMSKERSAQSFSLISLVCALAMVIVGDLYWSEELRRFGAASYLYYGGVFSLSINILGLASSVAKWWALKDGKISLSERRVLWLLGVSSTVVVICDVVVVIWGSVVVFTNYASWTYEEPSSDSFCHKTPMLFAFILLLIKWLLIPAICVLGCISAICCPNTDQQITQA